MIQKPQQRWKDTDKAQAYASTRWSSKRREQRDPRLVQQLLRRLEAQIPAHNARVLDVPAGTGRLLPGLLASGFQVVSADISPAMLAAHRKHGNLRVQADAMRLPFENDSFDLVVCCRLLHHLGKAEQLRSTVGELLRVSRGPVIASFWDSACLPELGRRLGRRAGRNQQRPRGRIARARKDLSAAFEVNGARVLAHAASLRFVSRQTFLLASTHGIG